MSKEELYKRLEYVRKQRKFQYSLQDKYQSYIERSIEVLGLLEIKEREILKQIREIED